MLIGCLSIVIAQEGRYHDDETGLRKVKVGNQTRDDPRHKTGPDENLGLKSHDITDDRKSPDASLIVVLRLKTVPKLLCLSSKSGSLCGRKTRPNIGE